MEKDTEQYTNGEGDIPKIRTFQSDIADALKNQKGSVVKVAVAEQARRDQEGQDITIQKKRSVVYVVMGVVLILMSIGVSGYVVFKKYTQQAPIVLPTKTHFLKGDHTTEISTTDTNLIPQQIDTALSQIKIPVGQVEQIMLVTQDEKKAKTLVPLKELLASFFITPSERFMSSLSEDVYLIGGYQITQPYRFILLKTTVFSITFSELLTWETTIAKDFSPLLHTTIAFEDVVYFKDKIIKNEDTRVGYVGEREVFAYTFFGPKKELLLIAPNTDVLSSLIVRFSTKLLEQ